MKISKDAIATIVVLVVVGAGIIAVNWSTWFPVATVPVVAKQSSPSKLTECKSPSSDAGGYVEAQPIECGVQTFEVTGVLQFYTWLDREDKPCRGAIKLPSGGSVFFEASLEACRVEWYRKYPKPASDTP